ncbi:MAG: replicative DNA helicase, partial [Alistipes sp.]|nr:replicative DNA helicase [Alistipes sp.]
ARCADRDASGMPPSLALDSQQAYDDYASGSNGGPMPGGMGGLGSAAGGGEFDLTPPSLGDEAPF